MSLDVEFPTRPVGNFTKSLLAPIILKARENPINIHVHVYTYSVHVVTHINITKFPEYEFETNKHLLIVLLNSSLVVILKGKVHTCMYMYMYTS